MRLGVVEGNARAERFWERCAFTEVRKRHDIEMGARTNTVRVMARPLDGGTVREYLALVARDRTGAFAMRRRVDVFFCWSFHGPGRASERGQRLCGCDRRRFGASSFASASVRHS